MSTAPPPTPRRRDYSLVWLLLGVVVLAGGLVFTGIYVFSRYLVTQVNVGVHDTDSGRSVDVQTPAGSLHVNTGEVSEKELGLPLYPGARRVHKEGATVSLEIPEGKSIRALSAQFETDDSLEKVGDFYRRQLGREVHESRDGAGIRFFLHAGAKQKLVILHRKLVTEITLANLTEADTE